MDGLVDLVTKKPSLSPAIGHSTSSDLLAGQGQVFRVFDNPVIDTGMTNPLCSTGAFRDSGAGAGARAGLGNF